jgi:hypothetical protein
MAKITVEILAEQVRATLGGRLVSLVLFGSAARGNGGGSADVLMVCDAVDDQLLATLAPVVRGWIKEGHPAPLIFAASEWRASADAFAIELEDIRAHHRVLAGADPWSGLTVRREDLRRQLEHELRGKVLRLRQAFVAVHHDPRALGAALTGTVAGFLTMLRALLRLTGREAPGERTALVGAAATLVGFNAVPVAELAVAARDRRPPKLDAADARATGYLDAVTRTAEYVNALPTRST